MAQPNPHFFDEAVNAVRGCIALITGKRDASAYFDFRQGGLVGSLIAIVVALAVQAFGPQLLGQPGPAGLATTVIVVGGIVIAVQYGVAWVVLRLLGRNDGIVPFMVVQNWVSLLQAVLAVLIIAIFGEPISIEPGAEMAQLTNGSIPFLALGILALVVSVNIGRLILTLRPAHVALFVVAQLLTALIVQPVLGASI